MDELTEGMNWNAETDAPQMNETDYNETQVGTDANFETQMNRDPLYIVLPITVIYGTIFLTGIIGNISTCVVIARNKHMHTATNYYLFSLAISDLLLLLSGLPPEMYVMWRKHSYVFGEAFCILQSFAAETSANATVLTITAFTVERYVAICHPFQSHTLSKLSRAVKFVVAIWFLALCLAVPQAIQYGIVAQAGPSSSAASAVYCTIKKVMIQNAFVISTCVFFVTPMTIITVLYILIGVKLRKSRLIPVKRPSACERSGDTSKTRPSSAQSHVIKMLVAVVVAFFICWAPFHAQRLMAMYFRSDIKPSNTVFIVYDFLTYISGVMYYLSTTINPLLYHIMSHKFREAFKSTLAQIVGRKRRRGTGKKLYISLERKSNRLAYYSQNGSNIMHIHGLRTSSQRMPLNDSMEQMALTVENPQEAKNLQSHLSMLSRCSSPSKPAVVVMTAESPKITRIADLQRDVSRSRGSSNASQLTLTTSYGRGEEDPGPAGGEAETILMHSQNAKCNGKTSLVRETNVDEGDVPDVKSVLHSKRKPKCTCLNCDKSKGGIASMTKRCLFKAKSQTTTLESIAKRIRQLPNATRSKFARERGERTDSGESNRKLKVTKTNSSNTISNSSLQDLDESEFTSSELAEIMGQLKNMQHFSS